MKEGGGTKSFHVPWNNLPSMAIDIYPDNRQLLPIIYKIAITSGKFNGIGLKENSFIHLDISPRVYIYTYVPGGTKVLNPDILSMIKQKTMFQHMEDIYNVK